MHGAKVKIKHIYWMLLDSWAFSVIWYSEETEFQKCVLFSVLYDTESPETC